MTRTNSLTARFPDPEAKAVFCEFAAASDACYNQINYTRRQTYFDPDGDVFDVDVRDLREEYVPVIGSGTFDQLERRNRGNWRTFFTNKKKYTNPTDDTITERPSPPGYWGNRSEGYPLHTLVRNDLYEIEWTPDGSTVEFTIGQALKKKYDYGHYERLRLELVGEPRWIGKQGQLELWYDEDAPTDVVRVRQTMRQPTIHPYASGQTHTPPRNAHTQSASVAALDLGANNTITCVTDTGEALVFNARTEFERFYSLTERIADLQSKLPSDEYSSRRIRRRYRQRTNRRDHHRDAAVRHVANWLCDRGVNEVIVGDLSGVLDTHWQARVNEKNHAFWSHGQLTKRLACTFENYGLELRVESEAGSSSTCPSCGADSEAVDRDGDAFHCLACEAHGHADVMGALNILQMHSTVDTSLGLMAQPAAPTPEWTGDGDPTDRVTYLTWDDHAWRPTCTGEREHAGHSTNEASAHP